MSFLKSGKKQRNKFLKKRWFSGFFPVELFNAMKRNQIMSKGSLAIFLLILFPIFIWLVYNPKSIQNPIIALAKFNAFMAISTLSINFFLSTRLKFFEKIFNGLDRTYRVHKVIGRTSLLFIMLHPLFLIISRYQNFNVILTYVIPIGSIEIAAGVIAVYIFLILITLTVAIKLPYHWWHNSHKFLGLVLILAGFHAVFAGSDINTYSVLKFWVIFLCTLGVVSWVYMLLFYKTVGKKHIVYIEKLTYFKDVTEISFRKPIGFTFQPGQYIYMRFPRFEGYKELFPFSISNDPSQNSIRLSIKKSGDYTSKKIPMLKTGDKAIMMGPYGTFGESYLKHDKDMLWIAGGIGITPFLSLAKHESKFPSGRKIVLFWAIKNQDDAFHDTELETEKKKNKNFEYVTWISQKKGRFTLDNILEIIKDKIDIKTVRILMCGPPPMIYRLSHDFRRMGVSYHDIFFEDFNMLD
jgi:predicted ferric reductase